MGVRARVCIAVSLVAPSLAVALPAHAAPQPKVRVWKIHYRAHNGERRSAYVVLPAWYGPRKHPAIPLVFSLLAEEGLCLGGSSAINVAGAIRLARDLGPGHTIVTVLADYGTRYQSKLFNPQFLRSKGLPVPEWLERRSAVEAALV